MGRPRGADVDTRPLRSFLFAPGDDERKLKKLATISADAVVLDLEDAVAESEKVTARRITAETLGSYATTDTAVLVRVNALVTGLLEADLRAVVAGERLDGVVIPKVEEPATLATVDQLLDELESEQGLPAGTIAVFPLVETAEGLMRVEAIAAAAGPRAVTLMFGLGDFSADIGVDLSAGGEELLYARSRIVVAARACGLGAPIDGPYLLDLEDIDGLIADTRRSRALGFRGRVVVHPSHVEPVQRAYSVLSAQELARARRIVEAFEAAERAGRAALRVDGRFVDYPPYQRAREQLRLYELAQMSESPAS